MNGTTGAIPVVGTASNTTPDTVNLNLTAQASPQITVDKTNYFGTSPAPGGQVVYRIYVDNSATQANYDRSRLAENWRLRPVLWDKHRGARVPVLPVAAHDSNHVCASSPSPDRRARGYDLRSR